MTGKNFLPSVCFLLFFSLSASVMEENHHLLCDQGSLTPERKNFLLFSPSSPESWEKTVNMEDKLVLTLGSSTELFAKKRTVQKGNPKTNGDTAWNLFGKKFSVSGTRTLSVQILCSGSTFISSFRGFRGKYVNRLLFFDETGKCIGQEALPLKITGEKKTECRKQIRVPEKAVKAQLELGADSPDLAPGNRITFHEITVRGYPDNTPYFQDGFFVTAPFRTAVQMPISWKGDFPPGTDVLLQAASAPDLNGRPGKFSEFSGPDGKNSFYRKRMLFPPSLMNSKQHGKWMKLKVFLRPSAPRGKAPVLRELTAGSTVFRDWNTAKPQETAASAVRLSRSPSANVMQPLVFQVQSEVPCVENRLRAVVNGKDVTSLLKKKDKEQYSYLPDGGFRKKTVYKAEIFTETVCGKKNRSVFYFFYDDPLTENVVTIRKDGFLLIDGKPHFPIGATYVVPVANEPDVEKAFRWLKAAGVNNVFGPRRKTGFREYLDKVAAHGLKMYVSPGIKDGANCKDLDLMLRNIAAEYRHPAVLGWYIGDDTLSHNTPEEMRLKNEAIRSIDPYHITVQADVIGSTKPYQDKALAGDTSRYRDVVNFTDNFRVELYPVTKLTDQVKKECIPEVICDMRTVFRDIRDKAEKPKNVWAIIQYFEGWSQ